ncbi:MAG: autotransporter-associated beta strand repeat-containing protein [Verrucomicrobiales bacterium]|nr:autotransporter-associated beta strand repeat-containing protein [Verrucomicrobiales bacterium]
MTFALAVRVNASMAGVEADVLCAYAPSYAASVGGEANAQVILANCIVGNNFLNRQSGTGARVRIVGYYQSTNDPVDWTTTGGMVNWLANNDSRVADVVAYGAAVGADLVMYVVKNSDSGSVAAVAQQPGTYSVYNPSAVWYVVVAHELGHNYNRTHNDGLVNPKTIMLHNYCSGGAAPPYFFTNPKIWFNGVQLQGDPANNCNMGALVNGGDNSSPSPQPVADRRSRPAAGPNLNNVVLRWVFTNAAGPAQAGTTNFDLVRGAPAVVRGNGATYTGRALRIPGGTTGNVPMNSMSAYIDLPNGIISAHTNVTIEIWAALISTQNWGRVFDFGRTIQAGDGLGAPGEYTGMPDTPAPGTTQASDNIMLSAFIGTDINQQRFEARLNAGTQFRLDSGLRTSPAVPHLYTATFTAGVGAYASTGGRWQWYRDGYPIGYIDVPFRLAEIEDVNNWLGRSMWSSDNNTAAEYLEVRISNVALSAGEVLANYMLGPHFFHGSTVWLTNSDAPGSSSFNMAGNWSSGSQPSGTDTYDTLNFTLRTPATTGNQTFAGAALRVSGGTLTFKGTTSATITVTNLTLDGGTVHHGGSGTCTLAGNVDVTTNGGVFNAVNGPLNVTANLRGHGPITILGANQTTLSGINTSFTGRIYIGNGAAGTLVINSPARLGASPAVLTPDQLVFNRGTLQTTATMALDDPNRGVLLDVSGGTFNVASGTTLTLACVLSTPVTPANVVVGALTKSGSGTLILASPSNTFRGTVFVDTGSSTANDGVLRIANNRTLAFAQSPIFIRNNNSGSSTLELDGAAEPVTLPQAIALNGRNNTVPAIRNLAGTNTIAGGISINVGGSYYIIQSDAGRLTLGGVIASAATGTRTITFQGSGEIAVTGVIANSNATVNVTKAGPGLLILEGTNSYTGTTMINGGTLLVNGTTGTGAVTVGSGAVLAGTGTISGSTTVASGGTLSPGAAGIGTLTFQAALSLQPGSTTRVEIARIHSTNDTIRVRGALGYDGALVVTNLGGELVPGDRFKLFEAGGYTGAFAHYALPPLASNRVWKTTRLAVDGALWVVSTEPPVITELRHAGQNIVLAGVGGTPNWTFYVRASTNVALPVADWVRIATNSFNPDGSFAVTNAIEAGVPQQFYIIEVE